MSRGLVLPSPSSDIIAAANGNCLDIYDLHTLSLLHTTTAADSIVQLAWGRSPNFGEIVAASSSPSNSIVVVRIDTGEVVVDVHDSPIAIAGLQISDRGHLLIAAEHGLSLTIVSVDEARRLVVLPFVKHIGLKGLLHAFSPDNKFVAVVTRKDGIDGVCVISLTTSRRIMARRGTEQLGGVTDIAGIQWKDVGLLLSGGPTDPGGYHALALISPSGRVLMRGDPSSPNAFRMDIGSVEKKEVPVETEAYGPGLEQEGPRLGINTASADLKGALIAIGGYDGKLRLINTSMWSQAAMFGHEKPEVDDTAPPVIFRERTKVISDSDLVDQDGENSPGVGNAAGHGCRSSVSKKGAANHSSYFEVLSCEGAVEITKRVSNTSGPHNTKFGVSFAEFSPCGNYVASRCDKAGNVVFVWDVKNLRLFAVLILEEDARCIQWSKPEVLRCSSDEVEDAEDDDGPERSDASEAESDLAESVGSQLAIVSGGEYVYLWRRSGAAAVRVRPAHKWRGAFGARKVCWAHANRALIVGDGVSAKAFLAVYPV